jgi:hypothetical protein
MTWIELLLLLASVVLTIIEAVFGFRYVMRHPQGGAGFLFRSGIAILIYGASAMLPVVIVILTLPAGGRSETEALWITLGILAWVLLCALWLARCAPHLGAVTIPRWVVRHWSWPDWILISLLATAIIGLIYQT